MTITGRDRHARRANRAARRAAHIARLIEAGKVPNPRRARTELRNVSRAAETYRAAWLEGGAA